MAEVAGEVTLPRCTLIVEDDANIRRLLERTLRKRGHRVIACADGDIGWQTWQAEQPDLVILDWMLPGITGIEICRRIRGQPGGDIVTIIIETAKQAAEDLRTAFAAGADDYLPKPLSIDVLEVRFAIAEALVREKSRRAEALRLLTASERLYRTLVEAVPDTVYKLDADGRFVFVSSAVTALGYQPEDLIGRHFSEILAPGEAERVASQAVLPLWAGKTTGAAHAPRLFDERRGGDRITRNLELRLVSPVNPQGDLPVEVNACGISTGIGREMHGTIGVIRDITLRKLTEQALVQAERMAAVGTLTGGIAHEFNNLHAVVRGYLELTLRCDDLPEKVREWLNIAYQATRQASEITRNLLALCGKRPLMRAPASLQRIIENTLTIVRHEFETEGLEVRQDLRHTPTFAMDAAQIGQVAMNLIINARQAMLAANKRILNVECGTLGDEVFFCVTDTGCGIAADDLPRIFTPFYTTKGERAEGAYTQGGIKGIGLGLTVSRRIVEEHGGRIEVESELGRGTSFSVWLPVRDAVPETAQAVQSPLPVLSGRVLILEDEPKLRMLFAEVLQRAGLVVETTDDGEWARRRLAMEHFDLVLLDLQMPLMSGYRFLDLCQKADLSDKPHFLIMTGKLVFEPPSAEGLEIVGFLAKPFSIDRLCECLEVALRK